MQISSKESATAKSTYRTPTSNGIDLQLMTVTPDLAREWLSKNNHNRSISKGRVFDYAQRILDGKWMVNGESIKFSDDGILIDGQHRLLGVIKANAPINTYVMTGLPRDAFKTIDGGKARNGGDALSILGYSEARTLSAAIKIIISMQQGLYGVSKSVGTVGKKHNIDPIDEVNFIEKNKELCELVPTAHKMYRNGGQRIGMGKGLITALYFLFEKKDPKLAYNFLSKLCYGINLELDDPIWLLRDRLERVSASTVMTITSYVKHGLIVKTWNFVRQGTDVKQLKFTSSDPFPKIM